MKCFWILFFLIWGPAANAVQTDENAQQLKIDLSSKQQLLDKMLIPIWKNIDYKFSLSKNTNDHQLGIPNNVTNSIELQLVSGEIELGKKPNPLFEMNIIDRNMIKLNWKLENLSANIKAKVRFQFKKYGVKVTHDEYFIIQASSLRNSQTELELEFSDVFNFKNIKNTNFKFENVIIRPQNGVSAALRYIFDFVFSEIQVDKFITEKVNLELQNWINSKELLGQLQDTANQQMTKLGQQILKLEDLASHLKLKVKTFDFSTDYIRLGVTPSFSYEELSVHPCAMLMYRPSKKDHLSTSHSFIEKMINNFLTFKRWKEAELQEPILCFGHQDYDENHDPLGADAFFHFLGREIKFKYWIVPSAKPKYSYLHNENLIKFDTAVILKIKANHYPQLKINGDQLRLKLSAYFKVDYLPEEGLHLFFNHFDLTSIQGRIKVKWNSFLPYIRLPLSLVHNQIEKIMNREANNNYTAIQILPNKFELPGALKVFLEDYQMNEHNHTLIFTTR